jgi:hypothetical protein
MCQGTYSGKCSPCIVRLKTEIDEARKEKRPVTEFWEISNIH